MFLSLSPMQHDCNCLMQFVDPDTVEVYSLVELVFAIADTGCIISADYDDDK